jgi:hypothetical protein
MSLPSPADVFAAFFAAEHQAEPDHERALVNCGWAGINYRASLREEAEPEAANAEPEPEASL